MTRLTQHSSSPARASRRRHPLARLAPLFAAGLVGAVLPVSTAEAAPAATFSGFATSAVASPLRLEIYEPTIPIPSDPQLELEVGYTMVEADTSSSHGRSSLPLARWPDR